MDKALRHVDDQAERDQILAALYQMKGLVARDLHGSREEARADLQRALEISEQIGDTEREVLLLTQLGTLEELDSQIDKAMDLYEKALREARQAQNCATQLDCYDKLARLALAVGEYKLAGHWCQQQLRLSKQMSRVFYEARAHEGLGWVFFKAEDYVKAYKHARQALAIEEQITGPRAEAIQSLVIRIADDAMGVIPLVRPYLEDTL
jgi:tetratricopeptide (TPR) repeat protein